MFEIENYFQKEVQCYHRKPSFPFVSFPLPTPPPPKKKIKEVSQMVLDKIF